METLWRHPAVGRLGWLLELLGGSEAAALAVDDNLDETVLLRGPMDALAHSQQIPRALWTQQMAVARQALDPFELVGVEIVEGGARARLFHGGAQWVVTCFVDPEPPGRIATVMMMPRVPAELTPRLPMDFAEYDFDGFEPAPRASLIVFGGLPGTGKSSLADAVGRALHTPVFAADWIAGALTPFGVRLLPLADFGGMVWEQMTTSALRQLALGQSAILDSPMEDLSMRDRWRSLAERWGADYVPILCVCPDIDEHRRRLEGRHREIPGWHNTVSWDNVARRAIQFTPWNDAMVVDTTADRDATLTAVIARIRGN